MLNRLQADTAAKLDAITPSLPPSPRLQRTGLAAAFGGQLVPHYPNDEPASVLLEQVGVQRKNTYESRS